MPARAPDGAGPDCRDLPRWDPRRATGKCWACTRVDPSKEAPTDSTNPCTQYGVPEGSVRCDGGGGDGRGDQDVDTDLRSSGLNPKDLLKWR